MFTSFGNCISLITHQLLDCTLNQLAPYLVGHIYRRSRLNIYKFWILTLLALGRSQQWNSKLKAMNINNVNNMELLS